MRQVSRGRLGRLRCTPAGFTAATLDGNGLRGLSPTRPDATASLSGSCPSGRIFAIASFRRPLAVPPLRVACPSPPSGWAEDLHLPVTKHARHTGYARWAVLPAAKPLGGKRMNHTSSSRPAWRSAPRRAVQDRFGAPDRVSCWWRRVDLNHRPRAYESPALPLSYTAITIMFRRGCSRPRYRSFCRRQP